MSSFSLSIRLYATDEAGCWARFTFSRGWAEIAILSQSPRGGQSFELDQPIRRLYTLRYLE